MISLKDISIGYIWKNYYCFNIFREWENQIIGMNCKKDLIKFFL